MKYNIHKYTINSKNENRLYKVKEIDITFIVIDHFIE